jgi:hypothetical protein
LPFLHSYFWESWSPSIVLTLPVYIIRLMHILCWLFCLFPPPIRWSVPSTIVWAFIGWCYRVVVSVVRRCSYNFMFQGWGYRFDIFAGRWFFAVLIFWIGVVVGIGYRIFYCSRRVSKSMRNLSGQ